MKMFKPKLHPNSYHNTLYNFEALVKSVPELEKHLIKNPDGIDTLNFSNQEVVYLLNKALLLHFYKLDFWDIPKGNLIPPVPGRADYLHYLADLWQELSIKTETKNILDIGTGASLIYPIIGTAVYNWNFVAVDIETKSLEQANQIINKNQRLQNKVHLRLQLNKKNILKGIVLENDYFDAVICNPPFFKSAKEAAFQSTRKIKGLTKSKPTKITNNFSGLHNELWCDGGERLFLLNLIYESNLFKTQVNWFTSLVSNEDNLKVCFKELKKIKANYQIIEMSQGNKKSRILAWKF